MNGSGTRTGPDPAPLGPVDPPPRRNRGPGPEDGRLFAESQLTVLRTAVTDLSWLLGRGYGLDHALTLVGDRHQLHARQRLAVRRSAGAAAAVAGRAARLLADLGGAPVTVDGFNLLNTLEVAVAGGVVLRGRDGALRDIAGIHGTWRRGRQTAPAIALADAALAARHAGPVRWLLDRPISNSGRLAALLRTHAAAQGRTWEVQCVDAADRAVRTAGTAVATADAGILDAGVAWCNLAAAAIAGMPRVWLVDLGVDA